MRSRVHRRAVACPFYSLLLSAINLMKEYIKQFQYLLDVQAKKTIPFLIIAFVFSSLLDVVGVGLIGVFLGLLTDPHFFLLKFPDIAFFQQEFSEKKFIIYAGILIISAFSIKAVLALIIQKRVIFFCQSLSIRLKIRMMTAYQYAPYIYHLEKNSAYLLSRIQANIDGYINNVLLPVLNLISSSLIAIFILSLLLILHPFSTGFLIIMFILLGVSYDLIAKRKLSSMGKVVAEASGEIVKSIHQGLHGLTEIRVLGKEEYFLKALNKGSRKFAHAYGVLVAAQLLPRYLVENTIAIFIVGLSIGGIIIGVEMGSVVAIVGMFAAAGARLLPTVNQIMSSVNQVRGYHYHMHLIYEDLVELDRLNGDISKRKLLPEQEEKFTFSDIQLTDICYHYPHTNHAALKNVNMMISRGQSVGIIGPSGAGKSTLINLILGFVEPQQGYILVDGKTTHDLRAWLTNFAYIPQSIFLIDDTLRRNIALGVDDENIDEVRVWNAIKMAQLNEVAHQLQHGADTLLGENGARLSGGQRQRVALARAFYHERDIIIMDEATSSLDHETENEVINTIKRLKGNKTLIVIAHRLTTVEHCDVLYRLEAGRITAVGSFQEVVGAVN
jgi:ATP-binding cassette, subfamily B, bacterial PglK